MMSGSRSAERSQGQVSTVLRLLNEVVRGSSGIPRDSARRFSEYAKRLEVIINQVDKILSEPPPPPVQTALRGIAADLRKVEATIDVYNNKCKIYLLIHCRNLCKFLQETTQSIGNWLALLDLGLQNNNDLQKKSDQLSREMQQAQFAVSPFPPFLPFSL